MSLQVKDKDLLGGISARKNGDLSRGGCCISQRSAVALSPHLFTDSLNLQTNDLGHYIKIVDVQFSHRHRQLKPSWPGAAGIDEHHAVARHDRRLVGMAADDDPIASCGGVEIESI